MVDMIFDSSVYSLQRAPYFSKDDPSSPQSLEVLADAASFDNLTGSPVFLEQLYGSPQQQPLSDSSKQINPDYEISQSEVHYKSALLEFGKVKSRMSDSMEKVKLNELERERMLEEVASNRACDESQRVDRINEFMKTTKGSHLNNIETFRKAKSEYDSVVLSLSSLFVSVLNSRHAPDGGYIVSSGPVFRIMDHGNEPYEYTFQNMGINCTFCNKTHVNCFIYTAKSCKFLAGHAPCVCTTDYIPLCNECFYAHSLSFLLERAENPSCGHGEEERFDCWIPCPVCRGAICPYGVKIHMEMPAILSTTITNNILPTMEDLGERLESMARMDRDETINSLSLRMSAMENRLDAIANAINRWGGTKVKTPKSPVDGVVMKLKDSNHQKEKKSRPCKRCGELGHYQKSVGKCPAVLHNTGLITYNTTDADLKE